MSRPSHERIASFVALINDIEHTRYKMLFCGVHCKYQFLWNRGCIPPSSQVGVPKYTFGVQLRMEGDGTLSGTHPL